MVYLLFVSLGDMLRNNILPLFQRQSVADGLLRFDCGKFGAFVLLCFYVESDFLSVQCGGILYLPE